MSKVIDLTGQTFEYLTVLERGENTADGHAQWVCQCKCGNTAIVLGIMEDFEFIKEDIHISEGIIAYTDGITDAMNSNNEFYGEERLINFLNSHPFENKVINKLLVDIDDFTESEPQFDDMTLVLLDRHDLD